MSIGMADGSVEMLHHTSILRKQRGLEGDTFSKCVREELFVFLIWFYISVLVCNWSRRSRVGEVKWQRMWTNFDFLALSPEIVDGVDIYTTLLLCPDLNKPRNFSACKETGRLWSKRGSFSKPLNPYRRYHCVWVLWNCFQYRWIVVGSQSCTKWKTCCQFLVFCHLSHICWSRRSSVIWLIQILIGNLKLWRLMA